MKVCNLSGIFVKVILIVFMLSSFSFSKDKESFGGFFSYAGSFLHPTYIKSIVTNDYQLSGKWEGDDGGYTSIKSSEKAGEYIVEIFIDKKQNCSLKFIGVFFRVENNLFVDLSAIPKTEEALLFLTNISGHLIFKINKINQNTLQLYWMRCFDMLDIKKKYPKLLQYHCFEDQSRMVILSTSKQIVQALQNKYFVEDFFSAKEKVILKKKKKITLSNREWKRRNHCHDQHQLSEWAGKEGDGADATMASP